MIEASPQHCMTLFTEFVVVVVVVRLSVISTGATVAKEAVYSKSLDGSNGNGIAIQH